MITIILENGGVIEIHSDELTSATSKAIEFLQEQQQKEMVV